MLWGKECTVHMGACFSGGSRDAPAINVKMLILYLLYAVNRKFMSRSHVELFRNAV